MIVKLQIATHGGAALAPLTSVTTLAGATALGASCKSGIESGSEGVNYMIHHQVAIVGIAANSVRVLGTVPHGSWATLGAFLDHAIRVHQHVDLVAFDRQAAQGTTGCCHINGSIAIDVAHTAPAQIEELIRTTGADDFGRYTDPRVAEAVTEYSAETIRFETWYDAYARWEVQLSHGWSTDPRGESDYHVRELLGLTENSRASILHTENLRDELGRCDPQELDLAITDVLEDIDPYLQSRVIDPVSYTHLTLPTILRV